jgi:hypothetical protein
LQTPAAPLEIFAPQGTGPLPGFSINRFFLIIRLRVTKNQISWKNFSRRLFKFYDLIIQNYQFFFRCFFSLFSKSREPLFSKRIREIKAQLLLLSVVGSTRRVASFLLE